MKTIKIRSRCSVFHAGRFYSMGEEAELLAALDGDVEAAAGLGSSIEVIELEAEAPAAITPDIGDIEADVRPAKQGARRRSRNEEG